LALAAAERSGARFLARLFAYELGAAHDLAMRLAGCADRAFDRAMASEHDPAVALLLATAAGRLGDRFRRGLLTLQRLAAGPGGPTKIAGMVWGGPAPRLHDVRGAHAHDGTDPLAAAPAAQAPLGLGA